MIRFCYNNKQPTSVAYFSLMLHFHHGSTFGCSSCGHKGTRDETAATGFFMIVVSKGKKRFEESSGIKKYSGLEVTHVTFRSQFIVQNRSYGHTQSLGGQEVQPY